MALGALRTFTQSWFAEAVTLGHLLHSTTLAPGESTRVAVIDWSRRSAAGETEIITEADKLTNNTDHSRAISEVTNAVASEAQAGSSSSNTSSTTNSNAQSGSFDISSPLGGLFGGANGGAGVSNSPSTTDASSSGFSTTAGHRDITSSMLQIVNDRTHQNASSSRNRRASVVKEVSQNEHEQVSTRVIANYNHMHALTIQYYEVVQIFRVEVRLSMAEKVIFIPFEMPNFDSNDTVRRYQLALQRAALSYDAFQALSSIDTIEPQPELSTHFSSFVETLDAIYKTALLNRSSLVAGTVRMPVKAARTAALPSIAEGTRDTTSNPATDDATPPAPTAATPRTVSVRVTAEGLARYSFVGQGPFKFKDAFPIISQANTHLWNKQILTNLASLIKLPLLRNTSNALQLPTDTVIEGAIVTGTKLGLKIVVYTGSRTDKGITDFGRDQNVPDIALRDVKRITIRGNGGNSTLNIVANLTLNRNGVIFPFEVSAIPCLRWILTIIAAIRDNRTRQFGDHYSECQRWCRQPRPKVPFEPEPYALRTSYFEITRCYVNRNTLSGSGYKFCGNIVPVSQVVEPIPIRYVGNYLAFRTNINSASNADPDWTKFQAGSNIKVGRSKNDTVPLGSGGVFAEAVLGRSNCAEKIGCHTVLGMERFTTSHSAN